MKAETSPSFVEDNLPQEGNAAPDAHSICEPSSHFLSSTASVEAEQPLMSFEQLGNLEADGKLFLQFETLFTQAQSLPREELTRVAEYVKNRLLKLRQERLSEAPPLPECFDLYPGGAHDPFDWLEKHWGRWLKHFTPTLSRDYLFLDQLGELDPKLKQALYAKRRGILTRTGLKVSQIVPKKSVRLDYQIKEADPEELRAAVRTYALPKVRKSRAHATI